MACRLSLRCTALASMLGMLSPSLMATASTSEQLNQWIQSAATENLTHAPAAANQACVRVMSEEIAANEHIVNQLSTALHKDFALYVTVGMGWGSFHVVAATFTPDAANHVFGSDGEPLASTRISLADTRALKRIIQDASHFTARYSAGVKDGECGLFVVSIHGQEHPVLLPPGGFVESKQGNVIQAFVDWAEPHLPQE